MGFLFSKFFKKKLELCLLGLENSGKTTFVNQLMGENKKTIPTIGLNVKSFNKGSKWIFFIKKGVNMKVWDIGGQFQYRQNWADYAKLSDVIIYMVDSSKVCIKLIISSLNQYLWPRRSFTVCWIKRDLKASLYSCFLIKSTSTPIWAKRKLLPS